MPEARYSHTMCNYEENLFLFGGAGAYLAECKMRLSYNEVFKFDTYSAKWTRLHDVGTFVPKKRMSHVAAVFGSFMLVHGGFNTEGKIVLDDFNLFDLEE